MIAFRSGLGRGPSTCLNDVGSLTPLSLTVSQRERGIFLASFFHFGMRTVKVVGAGFSGLVTAYYLVKHGVKVTVVEKSSRPGGLIQTVHTEHGIVETAANGILNSAKLESMAAEIGVPLQPTRREGRKRFIFRGRPRQLPLTPLDVLNLAFHLARNAAGFRPRQFETVAEWGRRVIGKGATDYLLAPALGGIYAGDPDRLSASLIFGAAKLPDHLHTNRPEHAKLRGTVAPARGMQQLIDGLYDYLKRKGVEFLFNHQERAEANEPTVVCLSAQAASEYLAEVASEVAQALRGIEMLSLVTATCFFAPDAAKLKGFGCLFPRNAGFRARGVLFNDCIFEGRGPARSETWIFGGALDPDVLKLSDQEFAELIAHERAEFYSRHEEPLAVHVTCRPSALPHYSIELEEILTTLPAPPAHIALAGNYLGRIGLAKLIERAAVVAEAFGQAFGAVARP